MSKSVVKVYKRPAGGWGALKSVASQIMGQGNPAKGVMTLLSANQPDGFDCPGCAWPDANHRSTFEFCENGAKAVAAESTSRRVTNNLFERYTVTELNAQTDYWLEDQGRLTEPMRYDAASDRYLPVSWDTAFADIGTQLRALPSPDDAIFYTSGRTSNEAAFLYQLFVREFGTNNFPDCSNMCHEPSGTAMRESVGIGKGTVTLQDFEQADAIFIFGQNPGTNHPRMLGELRAAAKRGAAIISFNPLRERGLEKFQNPQDIREMLAGEATDISTSYYQLTIGGDLAAVKGMIKHVLEQDALAVAQGQASLLDQAFIAEHTSGFEALQQDVTQESWETLSAQSGLSEAQIRAAAASYLKADRVIACWGMGITQHQYSVATIQMITNLLLLRGHIGRPGAGLCPVRGHSNVQGDRTMGIHEKPAPALLEKIEQVFGFPVPRHNGYDTVGAIEAMRDQPGKVFFAMGGNFAAATPDTAETYRALKNCALTVHVTTKLNRSHLIHGKSAYILPCLGRTEIDVQESGPQAVTVEDSMSMVHLSTGMNAPASAQLLSEPMIIARLAVATLGERSKINWLHMVADYDRIRDAIAKVFEDFADFNQRVRVPGGFHLRNSARLREWRTATGKARFMPFAIPRSMTQKLSEQYAENLFTLATVRSHDQYNTTIYGMNDRYRGVFGERRVLFICADDLKMLNMQAGEWVDIQSLGEDGVTREAQRFLLVEYAIPRGCLAAYFPETNGLVPLGSFAERARTPTSKAIPVRLRKHLAMKAG
ncbi:FdhF/YdeP family oxidoreductase [Undibacterium squillarum]|uniref:FdhF/YdeP family oxidoreductase n=1 Tax=Undibacterium squillarum TaxID=1131567 RepID=UPI0035AFEAB2